MSNTEQEFTTAEPVVEETGGTAQTEETNVVDNGTQDQTTAGSVDSNTTQEFSEEDILNMSDEEFSGVSITEIGNPTQPNPTEDNTQVNQGTEQPAQQTQETQPTDNTGSVNTETKPEEVLTPEMAFYREVTAPFKANNTQVQIKDPKDAIRLMQMGLNYNEKMANLKPHMRILRSLDKAGLLDESKLNHLIDLAEHKPEAIAQLIKDSQVDTYSLPDLEEQPYQVQDHMLSQQQVDFEETVNNISGSTYGSAVLQAVHKWDETSMQTLFQNPMYLEQLTEQKETGLFDDTISVIKQGLALGKLDSNKPMVDLYNDVASYLLHQEGSKYAKPSWWKQAQATISQPTNTQVTAPANNAQQASTQREYLGSNINNTSNVQTQVTTPNTAPKTASITRGGNNPVQTRVNPQDILDMSDEEFEQFQKTVTFTK